MQRKPRRADEKLFNRQAAVISILQGFVVLLTVVIVFLSSTYRGFGEREARTMTFTSIVVANLALILTNRSWSQTILGTFHRHNNALWWIFSLTLLALGLVIYIPPFSSLFYFSPLQPIDLLICLVAGTISVVWFEAFKVFERYTSVN